jgi:ribosome-binding factor A|tara:strand:+ start:1926 stop:2258 length:333 start_codon:yes stop_codon:yes gene_type:complete
MASIRQSKIESVIQSEVSVFLQRNSSICLGTMVTVTVVRVTADLSLARCYLSIFGAKDKQEVFESIETNASRIRGEVGKKLKNLRKIPALKFHIDDSLDYASKIDELLKK